MNLSYVQATPKELDFLVNWLCSEKWPFHGTSKLDAKSLKRAIIEGNWFDKEQNQPYWIILESGEKIGFIRIFDLEDPTPMFDLRIKTAYRGKGIGELALQWLTNYIFTTMSDKIRIEGYTRQDNKAMRIIFKKCGYLKEAHHRGAWPLESGKSIDSIGYGITKEDWKNKKITPLNWNDEPKERTVLE